MFETITKKSHEYLDKQIQHLEDTCNQYPDIKEFVSYLIEYSDRMAYCSNETPNTEIGRELIQFIWQISNVNLSNMANQFHFSSQWAAELNSFIGNFFHDDAAFDFTQGHRGVFEFKGTNDDNGRWLQNPRILIEAAKANRAYYDLVDPRKVEKTQARENMFNPDVKVDASKVFSLLETV